MLTSIDATPVSPEPSYQSQPSGYQAPSGPATPSDVSSFSTAAGRDQMSASATQSQPLPTTVEELELQYLESEARRIQERRDELLRARAGQ